MQKGLRGEHDQTAESDGDTEGENQALTDTELYPVHPPGAEVLPDETGDGGTEGIADCPENTVDLRRHGPGGDDDRTERVDTDLDDHVGDTVHGVLEPGGDSETEHVAQVNALQLQLAKAQPIRLIRTDQTAGQKQHIDDLCRNCCDRHAGNSPMEKHHKHHIQDDVGDAADDHEEEGTERISDGAEHVGFHVQNENERDAEKINPQIQNRSGQGILRRLHEAEHGGRGHQPQRHEEEAQQGENGNGIAGGDTDIFRASGSVDLGNDDRCAGSHRDKEADQNVDYL